VRTKGRAYAENRRGYYRSLQRDVKSGRFGAISELLMFHAQKGRKADEVAVYPDDERVQETLKLARKMQWPLVVHIEFAALSGDEKGKYMEQLQTMLAKNPQHPFVMIHMGQLQLAEVRRLIESHPNVYFMTSHTTPAVIGKSKQRWTPMFQNDGLAPDWRELVIEKPDRFILAFDNVWPDHWGDFYLRQAEQWRKAFAALPAEVAHAVAHENAERLWRIPKR
jgi:predicted TIM-barrel fold metal-dependent hydrolase